MANSFRAKLQKEPSNYKAGVESVLIFSISDLEGRVIQHLHLSHEMPMHIIIVSNDLEEFYHLHPERLENGGFKVVHRFPFGGLYRIYVEFTPVDKVQVIERLELMVDGDRREATAITEDVAFVKETGDLRIRLIPAPLIRARIETVINFEVTDPITGQPVMDLQPYLGTLAHVVIISAHSGELLHVHPENHHSTTVHHDHESSLPSPFIATRTTFTEPGLYKVWVHFKRKGVVNVVPFVMRVE